MDTPDLLHRTSALIVRRRISVVGHWLHLRSSQGASELGMGLDGQKPIWMSPVEPYRYTPLLRRQRDRVLVRPSLLTAGQLRSSVLLQAPHIE